MIDTLKIYNELKESLSDVAAMKVANAIGNIYFELSNMVTKTEFNELKEIVRELSEAQKRTEQRVEELAEAQKETRKDIIRIDKTLLELAEAQRKTEQRVEELAEAQRKTEQRVEELAEAQRKTEQRVEELAEAQRKTEQRVEELAQAQQRTEQRVEELAEAQKRTEKELKELIGEHKKTREQIGGLTHTVGYILEDRAYKGLPTLLKRDFDIEVSEPIKRDFIEVSADRYIEVNIIGKGIKDGKEIWIIGECKSQLKKADIDEFLKILKLIKDKVVGDKQLIAVTYQTSPQVRRYATEKGIKVYFSYELPL